MYERVEGDRGRSSHVSLLASSSLAGLDPVPLADPE